MIRRVLSCGVLLPPVVSLFVCLMVACHTVSPPPPPPATAQLTVSWSGNGNPDAPICGTSPCLSGYVLTCTGAAPINLGPGILSQVVTVPLGQVTCTLVNTVTAPGLNVTSDQATWAGNVMATQSVRLGEWR